MNDNQFDAFAKERISMDAGGPSERVWRRIQERRRSWLPTTGEMLLAWAASAVLLVASLTVSSGLMRASQQDAPIALSAADDPAYTVAAVTSVRGAVPQSPGESPPEQPVP